MGEAFVKAFVDEMTKMGAYKPPKPREDEGFAAAKLKVIPRSFLARFMKSIVLKNLRPF